MTERSPMRRGASRRAAPTYCDGLQAACRAPSPHRRRDRWLPGMLPNALIAKRTAELV
jgi:hypothetical protein